MDNLRHALLPAVDLSKKEAALDPLVAEVVRRSSDATDWYAARKDQKRRWAVFLRVSAVVCASAAPIVPVIAVLSKKLTAEPQLLVSLASMLVSGAAVLVALDRLLGFSSGWMRYARSLFELQQRLETFQLQWQRERLRLSLVPQVTLEQLGPALELVTQFLRDTGDVVRKETEDWIAEFGKSLGESDRIVGEAKAAPAAALGALQIETAGFEKLEGHVFQLRVGDAEPREVRGATAVIERLPPGIVRVVASGAVGSNPVSVELAATIEAGRVSTLRVPLA